MTLSRDRKLELLAATPLLDGVDADGLARVADRVIEASFAPGHVVARQGDVGTGLFIIESGAVRVVRDGETLATLGPGDFFGELSVIDGKPRNAQVIADGPTVCLALATWDFEAVVHEQPAVALAILRGLTGRLRTVTDAQRH
jgi:CRP-like cAMP-binding protein